MSDNCRADGSDFQISIDLFENFSFSIDISLKETDFWTLNPCLILTSYLPKN